MMNLQNLDRRIIFAVLLIAVASAFLFPRPLHIAVEPPVQMAYDTLNKLQPGDRVLMAFDYGPSTMPELQPAALAILRHCFQRKVKVVFFTLTNEGLPMIADALSQVAVPLDEKENVDYVNLGFKWGGLTGSSVIEGLGSNMQAVFPVTIKGTAYHDVPLLHDVKNFSDFKALISFSAGTPGINEYIQYANARYHIPIVGAVTKVTAPREFPFLNSGQLAGMCAGLVGGAEYEELIDHPGFGMSGLFALSIAHLVVLGCIVAANIIYFFGRRQSSR